VVVLVPVPDRNDSAAALLCCCPCDGGKKSSSRSTSSVRRLSGPEVGREGVTRLLCSGVVTKLGRCLKRVWAGALLSARLVAMPMPLLLPRLVVGEGVMAAVEAAAAGAAGVLRAGFPFLAGILVTGTATVRYFSIVKSLGT